MHPALTRIDHRPWPVPDRPWKWRQSWVDLLFAHWPVPTHVLRPHVPPCLTIQEFGGTSWVSVVPFRMTGVTKRPLPDVPWLSAFTELNLRVYVEFEGRPGVWFLSLDAANPIAVWAARRWWHLPYFKARMSVDTLGDSTIRYRSERQSPTPVRFATEYAPIDEPYGAVPGTLDYFLTERYCLYALASDGALLRGEIHHAPWPLQRARATIESNELGQPFDIPLHGPPAVTHFAKRIDVVLWPLERVVHRVRPNPMLARACPALRPA